MADTPTGLGRVRGRLGNYRMNWLNISRSRALVQMLAWTFVAITGSHSALAKCNLSKIIGYTVVAEKIVSGFVQGGTIKDGFEGCDFDRTIIFSDNTGVRCAGYSYTYAFSPTAYIFVNKLGSAKMCIDDEMYEIELLH